MGKTGRKESLGGKNRIMSLVRRKLIKRESFSLSLSGRKRVLNEREGEREKKVLKKEKRERET